MRVLIVDDDPIAIELLRETLADAGHDVLCAGDGQEALGMLGGEQPVQVLITDWQMPGMNGVDLCQAVRAGAGANSDGGYVYIILLTSHGSVAERVKGLSAGADDFITKPFEPQELLARMQAADRLLS